MALIQWIPNLIELWRKQSKCSWTGGPVDKLRPEEAKSIASGIHRLSSGLTRDRLLVGETYFQDPTLFGAYLLYFWPVSYLQAFEILSTLPPTIQSLLDFGSGGGPLAAAAFDCGIKDITLIDRSAKALGMAKALFAGRANSPKIIQWDPTRQVSPLAERYDLIASQHCFNELWIESEDKLQKRFQLALDLISKLNTNGFFLLIEPALKSTSQEVLFLRDSLCAHGISSIFPCLHSKPCPVLKADDSCHVETPWDPPLLVRDLIQRAGLHKRVLKNTTLLFKPTHPNVIGLPRKYLVITEPKRAKNKSIFVQVCCELGRIQISILPKEVTNNNRALLKAKPGNIIFIEGYVESHDTLRLTSESCVSIEPKQHYFQVKA